MAELDAILSGETIPEAPVVEQRAEQPRGEDGRYVKTSEPPADAAPEPVKSPEPEAPPKVEPTEDRIPPAALLDERRKRQQYERELQELREELQKLKQPAKPPEADAEQPGEDFWSNPEAHLTAAEKRAIAAAKAEISEAMAHMNANISEQLARGKYTDYDEVRSVFAERLESDPVLRSELNKAISEGRDFGKFVYETGSRIKELSEVQNLDGLREKIRAEERARLEAEMRKQPDVPQSINTIPSPATSTETWSGPPPLDAILKR